ncbi:MAG: hypothetical protein CML95_06150 [Rhodobiaceae bacterium]|nr:hypothetical protein [Rhodobiaceae bacterium]|tara:strand:+ start:73 stop:372 length:300 start_codon:yes stop_codon:yes gene_type:complete
MLRIITALVFLWTGAASAQALADIGTGMAVLENFNESTLDRFGNPTFGLRAQREPELRRLRKMQGRPVLQGEISIFDLSDDEIDSLFDDLNETSKGSTD